MRTETSRWKARRARKAETPNLPRDEAPHRRRTGHRRSESRTPPGTHYRKGRAGDRANAVLAAAGYDFPLLLPWLERLLRTLFQVLFLVIATAQIS